MFRRETTEKGGVTAGEVAVTAGNVVAAVGICWPGTGRGIDPYTRKNMLLPGR